MHRIKSFEAPENELTPIIPATIKAPEEELSLVIEEKIPTHNELRDIINEIGDILGFVVKTEEHTPDGAYRCDVTWRDYEAHSPVKVFEIEVSGNVDHALSSLSHAYDMWRPEVLYLIVSDEGDIDRARRLVEPRLKGAFSRISKKLKVYTWVSLKGLYDALKPHKDFVKDLAKR